MNYYIDIQLNPETNLKDSPLMNLVFTQLHRGLVKLRTDQIGVSFPRYNLKLGRLLRLHSDQHSLDALQSIKWLDGLDKYCDISNAKDVPANTKFRTISRIRTNMTKSKLKRLKQRGSITSEQEKTYKNKMFSQGLDNPFLDLESGSTGQKHRRFIDFGPLLNEPVVGGFDSFGMSKVATVPWF